MQDLLKLLKQFQLETPAPTSQEITNRIREYLQILILKSIYHSKYGSVISFMGGTCLRICYDLKRYSEDLDFTLDKKIENYSFVDLIQLIKKDMEMSGFSLDVTVGNNAVVNKAYLRFSTLLQTAGLASRKEQKLHIKLEIDTEPVKVDGSQLESFFVSKYNEIFPILKHKKETLFAGKILAIFARTYAKGRDYYDLIWYLKENTTIDNKYLNDGIAQMNKKRTSPIPKFENTTELFNYLRAQIEKVDTTVILKDIEKFLEDPEEAKWIKDYKKIFNQFENTYLNNISK